MQIAVQPQRHRAAAAHRVPGRRPGVTDLRFLLDDDALGLGQIAAHRAAEYRAVALGLQDRHGLAVRLADDVRLRIGMPRTDDGDRHRSGHARNQKYDLLHAGPPSLPAATIAQLVSYRPEEPKRFPTFCQGVSPRRTSRMQRSRP